MKIEIPDENIRRASDTSAAPPRFPSFPEIGDIVTVGRGQSQWRVCEVTRSRYVSSEDRVILRDLSWRTRWAYVRQLTLVHYAADIANGDPVHVG